MGHEMKIWLILQTIYESFSHMVYTQCAGRLKLFSCLYKVRSGLKGGLSLQSTFLEPYRRNHMQGTGHDGPCTCKPGPSVLESSLTVQQDPAHNLKSEARNRAWFQSIVISCIHARKSPDASQCFTTARKEQRLKNNCLSIYCMCFCVCFPPQ